MAFPLADGDLVEAKIYCSSHGQYSINTLHYVVDTLAGVGSNDIAACVEIEELFAPLFKAAMSNEAAFEGVSAQIIRPTRRPRVATFVLAGVGTVGDDVLPRQVAGLVRKGTSIASRSGRGRMYVPFPAESHNSSSGFPTGPYNALLNAIAVAVLSTVIAGGGGNTATLLPILYRRTLQTGLSLTTTTAAVTWATCRRRSDVRGADRPPF